MMIDIEQDNDNAEKKAKTSHKQNVKNPETIELNGLLHNERVPIIDKSDIDTVNTDERFSNNAIHNSNPIQQTTNMDCSWQ